MTPDEMLQLQQQGQQLGQAQPGQPQGQATGTGPASMPVADRGYQGMKLAELAIYVQGMQKILADLPAGGKLASDLRKAINAIARHVPPNEISQGIRQTMLARMQMEQRQQQPMIATQRANQMPQQQPPMGGNGMLGQ
jgi:hypothetical protein